MLSKYNFGEGHSRVTAAIAHLFKICQKVEDRQPDEEKRDRKLWTSPG